MPDLGHLGIHSEIFRLLEIAPVNLRWLGTLYALLLTLVPSDTCRPKKIDHVLARWSAVKEQSDGNPTVTAWLLGVDDVEGADAEVEYSTSPPLKEQFGYLIAALYGKTLGSPTSSDIAMRCAYYGSAKLTAEEMDQGANRDPHAYELAVLCNDHVFHKRELRKLLEDQVMPSFEERYRQRCEQLHQRYQYFDPNPVTNWAALNQAETERLREKKFAELVASTIPDKTTYLAEQVRSLKYWIVAAVILLVAVVVFGLGIRR
jgi:hypothetical protein